MTTTLQRNIDMAAALRHRGWDISVQRHGWDIVCIEGDFVENYLTLEAAYTAAVDHTRHAHPRG